MQALSHEGGMTAIVAAEPVVSAAIAPYADELSVAAINGPKSVVISGKHEAVSRVVAALPEEIRTIKLNVSHAFHSPLMEPMLADFLEVAREVTFSPPQLKIISLVTGELASNQIMSPEYWVNHVRQAVRFADGMDTLIRMGIDTFVEIGPKPVLLGMGRRSLPDDYGTWLPTLRPSRCPELVEGTGRAGSQMRSDWSCLLSSVGQLYVRGVEIDWKGFCLTPRRKVILPTYPFQRKRYWLEPIKDAKPEISSSSTQEHPWRQERIYSATLKKGGGAVRELPLQSKEPWHDWLYELGWRESKRANNTPIEVPAGDGDWLILADRTGVAENLANQLNAHGMGSLRVYPNRTDERLTADQYAINWTDPADWQQLLADRSYRGVVYLWSLDDNENESFVSTCGQVLHLVQALIKSKINPRLWLVTRGAQSVRKADTRGPYGEEVNPVDPWQAPLWGLGKVIALEHSELSTVCLDLPPDSPLSEVQSLLHELLSPDKENQVAYRKGVRHVARLERYRSSQVLAEGEIVRGDGSYLITGGLGALGLKMAQWLIQEGAQHLVLTGRSGANQTAKKVINQLEQAGAKISLIKADVTSIEDVKKVLSACPKLRGVVHAAGVLDDGVLMKQSLARFEKVMAPKVQGAWNLHQLTRMMALDFFVLFSSAASLPGLAGQGNYAAANAFMDALAHYRHSLALPALSINWGPWADVGMVAHLVSRFKAQGIKMIAPEDSLQVLGKLLKEHVTQVGVLPIDWFKFLQQFQHGELSLFSELALEAPVDTHTVSKVIDHVSQLKEASPNERHTLLTAYLRRKTAQVLGLDDPSQLDVQQPLSQMGLDSLMSGQLRSHIQNALDIKVPVASFLQNPTLAQLTTELLAQLSFVPSSSISYSPLVPIQPAGSKPPFFCVHTLIPVVYCFYDLANELGSDQPFYGLQSVACTGSHT